VLPEARSLLPEGLRAFSMPTGRSGRALDGLLQGKRYMLQNTTMMMHHPSGVARGQATDINNEVELLPAADQSETAAVVTGQRSMPTSTCSTMVCSDTPASLILPSPQQAKELLRVRNYVNNVLAHATGQPVEKIQHDFNRNK
jgi:ATP-dependent Clp protease, protease subunit